MYRRKRMLRIVRVRTVIKFVENLHLNQFQILGVTLAKLSSASYARIALTSQ